MRKTLLAALLTVGCFGTIAVANDLPTPRTGAADARAATEETTAAADSALVTSEPADAADITVYGGAFAQVQEKRTVTLKAGRNRIQLNGVAAQYRQDSLRLVNTAGPGEFTYRSGVYQPANLTRERLLADSVGKRITAWRHTKDGAREVTGTLQSVSGGGLIIGVEGGKTELVNSADVTLVETPAGLSNTASLVVEADVTAGGDYTIEFVYDTDGINWSAKHSLIFDDDKSTVLSWETTVSLVNESGTSFKNATLRLLTGNVVAADAPGRVYPAGAMLRESAPARGADVASVENVGDQKTYTIPGTVNLVAGQTRQIPLFTGKDVPVKRQYVVGNVTRYSADGKYDAHIRLTVENCEKHNLGRPLPAGLVKVYQYNSAKKLQVTGSTHVSDKAQDEVFDLNIGTSSDVKWEVKLASATPVADGDVDDNAARPQAAGVRPGRVVVDPVAPQGEKAQYEDHVYEVVVYNYKRDRDVTVKVEVAVPAKQKLEPKWLRPRADRAETELVVPKTGSAKTQYTVRTRVR